MNHRPSDEASSRREPLLLLDYENGNQNIANAAKPCWNVYHGLSHFVRHSVWPGLGLLGESYMLFSLGILAPVWQLLFPECYGTDDTDSNSNSYSSGTANACVWHHNAALLTVSGLILGMCGMGYGAQSLGRRRGSILTAALMALGGTGMMVVALCSGDHKDATSSSDGARLLNRLTLALFILGVGVGGEYPLSAASASERAMEDARQIYQREPVEKDSPSQSQQQQQAFRGRQVQLVFSMQGAGIFLNSFLLTVLLWMTHQRSFDYDLNVLLTVWQITYAVGALLLVMVLLTRVAHLQESTVWAKDQQHQQQQKHEAIVYATEIQKEKSSTLNHQYPAGASAPSDEVSTTSQGGHNSVTDNANNRNRSSSLAPVTTTRYTDPQQIANPIALVSSVSSLSAPSVVAIHFEPDRPLPDVPEHDLSHHDQPHGSGCCHRVIVLSPTWQLVRRHYGMRLLGASLCWFLWDVAFYGNKLFQSTFLLALTGGSESTTLFVFALAATLNAGVALMGYIGAAFLLDRVGRRQLQLWGFLATGTLFVGVGFLLEHDDDDDENATSQPLPVPLLVCMYLGSSFFGQLGPNATTFLIPAEIVPTELRTLGHGVAAASGKLGALVASLIFTRLDKDLDMFLLSGYASFLACAITYWTLPETATMDLHEHDRKWHMIRAGRVHEYIGSANHPQHLSVYERYTMQRQQQERHGMVVHDLHEVH